MCGVGAGAHANTWLSKTRITRVTVHDWGDAVFIYTSTSASQEGCSGAGNIFVLLRSNPQFKEIYSAALNAFHGRTSIGGFTYGCDPGHYNFPILQRIDLLIDENVAYP